MLFFFLKNFVTFLLLRGLILALFSFFVYWVVPFSALSGHAVCLFETRTLSQQCSGWAHPHFWKGKKRRPGRPGEIQAGLPHQDLVQQYHRENPPVIYAKPQDLLQEVTALRHKERATFITHLSYAEHLWNSAPPHSPWAFGQCLKNRNSEIINKINCNKN